MLDFPSLLYKGLRILMFQLSGVYCTSQHMEVGRDQQGPHPKHPYNIPDP